MVFILPCAVVHTCVLVAHCEERAGKYLLKTVPVIWVPIVDTDSVE